MLPCGVSAICFCSTASESVCFPLKRNSIDFTCVRGPTRLGASCATAGAAQAASSPTVTSRHSIRVATPQREPGWNVAALDVGPEPALDHILQLEARPQVAAGQLLHVAAQVNGQMHAQEDAGADVPSRRQREPSEPLLPDLEDV